MMAGPVLGNFFEEVDDLKSQQMSNVMIEYKNDVIKGVSLFSESFDQKPNMTYISKTYLVCDCYLYGNYK